MSLKVESARLNVFTSLRLRPPGIRTTYRGTASGSMGRSFEHGLSALRMNSPVTERRGRNGSDRCTRRTPAPENSWAPRPPSTTPFRACTKAGRLAPHADGAVLREHVCGAGGHPVALSIEFTVGRHGDEKPLRSDILKMIGQDASKKIVEEIDAGKLRRHGDRAVRRFHRIDQYGIRLFHGMSFPGLLFVPYLSRPFFGGEPRLAEENFSLHQYTLPLTSRISTPA